MPETLPNHVPFIDKAENDVVLHSPGINTPFGPMHIVGTNEHTGKVILANEEGLLEATPGEIGAWHTDESFEKAPPNHELTVVEDVGESAVENSMVPNNESRGSSSSDEASGGTTSASEEKDIEEDAGDAGEGGDEGPPSPPDDHEMPGSDDEEEPQPSEYLEDIARKEMEEEMAARRNGNMPKENDVGSDDKATEHSIPDDVRKAAEAHGLSIDYLIHAKDNQAAAERLRNLGIEWGPEPEPQPRYTRDPGIIILKQGVRQRENVERTVAEIEEGLRTKRGSLKVRSRLRRVGGPFPILRGIKQRRLANEIYQNELRRKEQASRRNPSRMYDTGLLGWGREERRRILHDVREIDKEIALVRSDLNLLNSYRLKKHKFQRHDLAGKIVRLQRQVDALDRRKLEPVDMYDHSQFKRMLKKYFKRTTTAADKHKYDDFPKVGEEPGSPQPIAGAESPEDRDATVV